MPAVESETYDKIDAANSLRCCRTTLKMAFGGSLLKLLARGAPVVDELYESHSDGAQKKNVNEPALAPNESRHEPDDEHR